MSSKRIPYSINFNPAVINALDDYIVLEKNRVFYEEGRLAHAMRCWHRNIFIEQAIKKLINYEENQGL